MSKEGKNILIIIITSIINILAPIMLVNTIHDYTKKSEIVGSPSNEIVISEYVPVKNYVFQENLSRINFVEDETTGYYLYSYYFSEKDFDSSKNNYSVFVNDYICTITALQNKAISSEYVMHFRDINKEVLNTVTIDISFEFYSSYSYLLLKIDSEDITYFNGFKDNPGFVLTLSAVDYDMKGLNKVQNNNVASPEVTTCAISYIVDDSTYFTTAVEENTRLDSLPTEPVKEGYNFIGWSIDGTNKVDVLGLDITEDTTFVALWDKYYTVTFEVDGQTSIQIIKESEDFALNIPVNPTIEGAEFKGWSVNGSIVDPSSYTITEDTTFVAVFDEIHTVYFIVDNVQSEPIEVVGNTKLSSIPEEPTKEGYSFDGWAVGNGTSTVNIYNYVITKDTYFVAVFSELKEQAVINFTGDIEVSYWLGEFRYLATSGDTVDVGKQLYVSMKTAQYESIQVSGATYKVYDDSGTTSIEYLVTVNSNNVTISPVEREINLAEDESIIYLTGEYKYFTLANAYPTVSLSTHSVVTTGQAVSLTVYSHNTSSVNVTGGTVTNIEDKTETANVKVYTISVDEQECTITITNKEPEQATVFFNDDLEVYAYIDLPDNVIEYDWDGDDFQNATKLSNGDTVPKQTRVYVITSQSLTDWYGRSQYKVLGDGTVVYVYRYEVITSTLVIGE